jgi:Lecithin retinol acyltransferase
MPMNYLCNCDPCTCTSDGADRAASSADEGVHQLPGSAPKEGARVRRSRKTLGSAWRRAAACSQAGEALEPPIGAHLITLRRCYTHHGIYAGQGSVFHYAGLARDLRPGPVEEVSLERFANGRPVHIECRSAPALDEQDIVSRARSRLGENRYRLLTNNCEHFSEWSRFGASRSHQVERWLGSAPTVTRTLAANIGSRLARFSPEGRTGALA